MTDLDHETTQLLDAARERGKQALGNVVPAAGLDHFTVYAGLIGSALELGKLMQTEERDMMVIDRHYRLKMASMNRAFIHIEAAMERDFQSGEEFRANSFQFIQSLVAAGQYEIASEVHKRLIEGMKRSALETILDARNEIAGGRSHLSLE